MADAITAHGTRQEVQDRHGPRRGRSRRADRLRAGPARTQRRRQDDHRPHPHHAPATRRGLRDASPGSTSRQAAGRAPAHRPLRAVRRRRRVPHRLREPRHDRRACTTSASSGCPRAGARAARLVPARGRRRPAVQDLLGRDAPPARPRRRAWSRTPPIIFLDEPTTGLDPRGRHGDVGGHPGSRGRRHHAAADHAVPRGGRPARRSTSSSSTTAGSSRRARPTSSRRRSAASDSSSPSEIPRRCTQRGTSSSRSGVGKAALDEEPVAPCSCRSRRRAGAHRGAARPGRRAVSGSTTSGCAGRRSTTCSCP